MPLKGIEDISLAYGLDHYKLDYPFRNMLSAFLGYEPDLSDLGRFVGREVYEVAYRVDRLSEPILLNWSVYGSELDTVWLDPREREVLVSLVRDYGVNRSPFQGKSWLEHYAGIYLVGDPGISCILTITIQTAYALYKYAQDGLRDLYKGLTGISSDVRWGATWFTEVQGGSDLGANVTRAENVGGVWRLSGYKYFASGAGLADIALVTARPPGSRPGAKGLALFAVPRINSNGSLNYRVRRLKWKSGTVSVPTGEVELLGSEAYLIGDLDKGIYYTMEDLMVSRLANSIGALGIARKAYIEAYGFSQVRRAFGKRIIEHPLLARDLLEAELGIEAGLALALKAIDSFDKSWRKKPPYDDDYHYARLLTHMAKNFTADIAADVTRRAMEIYGGIGFLHEFPIERWHREALITPIWEGTSNIQALDMLEAMVKKNAHTRLIEDLENMVTSSYWVASRRLGEELLEMAGKALRSIGEDSYRAQWTAKNVLDTLAKTVAIAGLIWLSGKTGNELLTMSGELYFSNTFRDRRLDAAVREVREIISLGGMLEEVDWHSKD